MNETWTLYTNELTQEEFDALQQAKRTGRSVELRGKRWLIKEYGESLTDWAPGGMHNAKVTLIGDND